MSENDIKYRPVEFRVWDHEDGSPRPVVMREGDILGNMARISEGNCTGWKYSILRSVEEYQEES